MALTAGSIFTGVGGFDMGFEAAGFRVAWQIEVDRDAVSVLERHWPDVPRHGDVRGVDPSALAPVDVVVFGSPCQDLSVAGKRAGLDGERSGLFHEAARIIAGLRPKPAVCVWENVAGALSSAGGRDFGAALDALADLGALDIAWRVLDARHWGVPQRRRRVFVVSDLGGERAAAILFEPEGGSGHPTPSGAAGQGASGDAADGAGVAGAPFAFDALNHTVAPVMDTLRSSTGGGVHDRLVAGVAGALRTGGYGHGTGSERGDGSDNLIVAGTLNGGAHPGSYNGQDATSGLLIPTAFGGNRTSGPIDVATACNAHGGPHGRLDFESETFVVADTVRSHPRPGSNSVGNIIAAPLTAGSHPNSNMPGRHREDDEHLVTVAIPISSDAAGGRTGDAETPSADAEGNIRLRPPSLGVGDPGGPSFAVNATGAPAVAFNQQGATWDERNVTSKGNRSRVEYGAPANTLHAEGLSVVTPMAVRRLTPVECERLMGWSDDHTRWRANGDEISDGPRYRMIGNGVVAPVAAWIAGRIAEAL